MLHITIQFYEQKHILHAGTTQGAVKEQINELPKKHYLLLVQK